MGFRVGIQCDPLPQAGRNHVAGLQALQRYVRVAQWDLGRVIPTSPDSWVQRGWKTMENPIWWRFHGKRVRKCYRWCCVVDKDHSVGLPYVSDSVRNHMNPLVFPSRCQHVASTAGIQKTLICWWFGWFFPTGKSTSLDLLGGVSLSKSMETERYPLLN